MQIKEVSVTLSAVVPTGAYANYRPSYTVTASIDEGEDYNKAITELKTEVNKQLRNDWVRLHDKDKVDYLSKVRWYEKNGKKYPSVTSVLGWSELLWKIRNPSDFGGVSEDELQEYAARGTIIHKGIEQWFQDTKGLPVPGYEFKFDHPELVVEKLLLQESKLEAKACNWLGFWEKYGADIKFNFMERAVFGQGYAGRLDAYGTWKGEPAVFDFKTTSTYNARVELKYFKQMSAYAKALSGVKKPKWLVIIPLNPSNKCGFGAPKIEQFSDNLFNSFASDLRAFNNDFKDLI